MDNRDTASNWKNLVVGRFAEAVEVTYMVTFGRRVK